MRSPADSGKIQRRNNKENLLGSPTVGLFEKKNNFIKTDLEENLMKHSRNSSSQWQFGAVSNPLSRKSSNSEYGVIRKEVGKIKPNKKVDPLKK